MVIQVKRKSQWHTYKCGVCGATKSVLSYADLNFEEFARYMHHAHQWVWSGANCWLCDKCNVPIT